MSKNKDDHLLPSIITERTGVLVPIKIDITFRGSRLVDSFCWNLDNKSISPFEFASQTCIDLNLVSGFRERIIFQITEQLESFERIVYVIRNFSNSIPGWNEKISKPQIITIGIRNDKIDFSDKILWNPIDNSKTPENFARSKCKELKLPQEMEPVIAHKIRETLFRWMIEILQNPQVQNVSLEPEFKVSETKVVNVPPYQSNEMSINLWKRARPSGFEESAGFPQPYLPTNMDSNYEIWK